MEQWQVRLFSPCLLMVLSWRFTSVAWGAIRLVTPEAMKKFIIAAAFLSATLASNAPAKDKQHIQAAQDAPVYQGAIMRFPNGNGFVFYIGPFPFIVPPLIVQSEALTGSPSRVNHP